jgi:Rrf2 family protein
VSFCAGLCLQMHLRTIRLYIVIKILYFSVNFYYPEVLKGLEGPDNSMRISAVEEYGLRCLLELARCGPGGQMSIAEIAEMEGLSAAYASKMLALLRKAGLVTAERGRSGGFSIARNPADITIYEVLTTLGGPLIDPEHCTRYSGQMDSCVHIDNCSVHDVLGGLAGYMQQMLSAATLADLLEGTYGSALRQQAKAVGISNHALARELNGMKVHEEDQAKKQFEVE